MDKIIHSQPVPKALLVINILVALIYFSWWLFPGNIGNPILYALLFMGECYHLVMALMFWQTIWPIKTDPKSTIDAPADFAPEVDIYITVCGETTDIVEPTALAAKNLRYRGKVNIYILNDGLVAKKPNWSDMETLAQRLEINCLTRQTPGGAKAGNINHALKHTHGEIVCVFDADMVPEPNFLEKTIPYFYKKSIGFVQTPQFYKNALDGEIQAGSWEQQEFFFGPIMIGKEKDNAAFICGTNVAIRRTALEQVGGMAEDNIAEDFLTSLQIHQHGWRSVYVPEVLATGLAPEDLLSYFKQQLRWARGSLEVLFWKNPLFKPGLSFRQKLQYLSSALYYFNGVIVLIDMVMPLLFLFFGFQPVNSSTTTFAVFFVPFMFLNLYTLFIASQGTLSFRAISFSQASWTLELLAIKSVLLREKTSFSVTPKHAQQGNFLSLAYPHLIYVALLLFGIGLAVGREGINPSVVTNIAWALFNTLMFLPYILASYNWRRFFTPKISPQKIEIINIQPAI